MSPDESAFRSGGERLPDRLVRVLLIENALPDAELVLRELRKAGFTLHADLVRTPEEFTTQLEHHAYDVILADYRLPNWNGMQALALLRQMGRDIPFLMVTGTLGEEAAVECIKQGVADYILKENLSRLPVAVERALKEKALREERGRAEQALRKSEARYRGLFENATHGIYLASLAGEFLDVNPALVRILGYDSRKELLSSPIVRSVYCNSGDREKFLDQYRQFGRIDGVETQWTRRDGSTILVRLSGRAVSDEQGELNGVEVIVEDITEQRSMEKHFRQVQKFEAIGQLAGGIAHDFNNVMGAIMGWAELGMDEAPPDSPLGSHFRKILDQTRRAAGLTRQLLAFARRQLLEPRNINLNHSIGEILTFLEKVISKDIELRTILAPELAAIRADPSQIEQVLMNLCLNARDAMLHGGRLVIETLNTEMDQEYYRHHSYARPGHYVQLNVSDNGTGMDAATLEHIFDPFFTTKETGKGTGLGLATVYGVVKQHGGFLNVYSEPGHGTIFRVYFPAVGVAEDAQRHPKAQQEPVRGGKETILVAEDHDGVREMARMTLESYGYRLLLARDGVEALELFEANRDAIALALLDVVMPKLSGPDAWLQMHVQRPELPVLFTTGYSAEAASLAELLDKGVAVLQKPYSPSAVGRKVRELLDQASPDSTGLPDIERQGKPC